MAIFLSLVLAGCGGSAAVGSGEPLTVAVAADLSPLTDSLEAMYREGTGRRVRFVVGSSGMLARQVEQGAPYDVFLSADAQYVEGLAKAGRMVPESVRVYAVGRLGIWGKTGTEREAKDLLRDEIRRVAIANPEHAPYGAAARDYLQRAGVWQAVEPKLVFGENVRQAAQFATSGNADALVSSWSTVRPLGGMLVPAEAHAPIQQAGGAVSATTRLAEAEEFLKFLGSEAVQTLLREHGFDVPPAAGR